MAEFILNPRRAPRAPVRCNARLALAEGGTCSTPTSDFGPKGCQLLAPTALDPGSRVLVELVNDRVAQPVQLSGRVAWSSTAPPWRAGVAFDAASEPAASGFFDQLAAAHPGYARPPDRIAEDAPLAPAIPPEVRPELTDEEGEVLRALGSGLGAGALRDELGEAFEGSLSAVFSLLGRRYVVVGPPDEGAAAAWAALLGSAVAAGTTPGSER